MHGLIQQNVTGLTLRLLVRSKMKLISQFPTLLDLVNLQLDIIEGDFEERSVLSRVIVGTDAIFMCVGTNHCAPGISVVSDTARAIIDVLEQDSNLKGAGYHKPTILQLRLVSLNPVLSRSTPAFIHSTLRYCLHYVYADVESACNLYQSSAMVHKELFEYVLVDPPAIHNPDHRELFGNRLVPSNQANAASLMSKTLNYSNLGAAFCDIAQRRSEFGGQSVGVSAPGEVKENWTPLYGYILGGLRSRV